MVIKSTTQIFLKDLIIEDSYDVIIVSSGYEDRCTFLVKDFQPKGKYKYSFAFNSKDSEESILKNKKFFSRNGYESISADGDNEEEVLNILKIATNLLNEEKKLKILVDYSSMTRVWYAVILKYFWLHEQSFESVTIDFFYSFAKYLPNKTTEKKNIHVNPIESFTSFSLPNKETALIIGLGYEKNKAYGLTEYFDATTFYFINDASKGENYSKEVLAVNNSLLKSVTKDKLYFYPINDMIYTENLLCSLCESLSQEYKIIIAPCGPKPFTLLSLIAAIKTDLVDVWRISPGKIGDPVNRKPDGTFSIYRVLFSQDLTPVA